jgi:hypothetical protein
LKHLVDNGLVPCIVGMWGYYLPTMGIDRVQKHWRYLVARYGAYPVVWCLAGEVQMPTYAQSSSEAVAKDEAAQRDGWVQVGRFVGRLDPFHNPITAHPGNTDRLQAESVLDIKMLQTGHSGYASLKPSVQAVMAANAQSPRTAVVNGEVCYEGILGGSWQDVQRFLLYTSILSGSAGHTYGAQGIWGMNSRTAPYVGATGSWGGGFWQDAMHYPGSAQMGVGRRFFERYPWWLFQPRREPHLPEGRISTLAAGIPGAVAVFYFPGNGVPGELLGMFGAPIQVERGAAYQAFYFNPRSGEEVRSYIASGFRRVELGKVTPDAGGSWVPPPKPEMDDWLLVLEDRATLQKMRSARQ